jgi:hypothetical protein
MKRIRLILPLLLVAATQLFADLPPLIPGIEGLSQARGPRS